jgi:hypothetical protein
MVTIGPIGPIGPMLDAHTLAPIGYPRADGTLAPSETLDAIGLTPEDLLSAPLR